MNQFIFKLKKKLRHFKYWMIRKSCSDEEWRTLKMVRAGYYGYCGDLDWKIIKTDFELNEASHDFLHSAEGKQKYDAKYGIAHKLIRDRENEIADCVSYIESYDPRRKVWICEAELIVAKES